MGPWRAPGYLTFLIYSGSGMGFLCNGQAIYVDFVLLRELCAIWLRTH